MFAESDFTFTEAESFIALLNKEEDEDQRVEDIDLLHVAFQGRLSDEEKENILPFYKILIAQTNDEEESERLSNALYGYFNLIDPFSSIKCDLGSDTDIIVDPSRKTVIQRVENLKKDKDLSKETIVFRAYPSKVKTFDSPLENAPRRFETFWERTSGGTFKVPISSADDLLISLDEKAVITKKSLAKDTLICVLDTYVEKGLSEIEFGIEQPGFFWFEEDGMVKANKYPIEDFTSDDLNDAIDVLEDLALWFKGREDKLATMVKWGLISAFNFARKQMGVKWMPFPFLYGSGGSGKSTLGDIVLYLWGLPDDKTNNIGGSSFDSPAKVGAKLEQSTHPIVVNEPIGALEKDDVFEMIKSAIESPYSRSRHEGKYLRTFYSFNPVIFTANESIPKSEDEGMFRRLFIMNFSRSERIDKNKQKAFEEKFKIKSPRNSPLIKLHALSMFFAKQFIEDSSLLNLDWQELANTLLSRLNPLHDIVVPNWLLKWADPETQEDLDDEIRERIRAFIVEKINREVGRINDYDSSNDHMKGVDGKIDVKNSVILFLVFGLLVIIVLFLGLW